MNSHKTKKTDFTPYKNAVRIGSGVWFVNHLKSFKIEKEEDINSLLRDINLLRLYFSCNTCKDHLNEYCREHPPNPLAEEDIKDYRAGKRPENLARWLVNAHNNANYQRFLASGNYYRPDDVKYEDVRDFFDTLGQIPCERDCDKPMTKETEKKVEETPKIKDAERGKLRLKVVSRFD